MFVKKLDLEPFLKLNGPTFDVRSPSEYSKGHIPGSINLPLFSDQERAVVGTVYKKQGKEQALKIGLSYAGPKLLYYFQKAKTHHHDGVIKVHCWRGGMRSSAIAMLLNITEAPVALLNGGYKSFRQWSQKIYARTFNYCVIGGMTGCGKTGILQTLKGMGEQVLDLEGLANHRGSSFGGLLMPSQPTTEQFQNDLALQLSQFDHKKRIWVEDESRTIGTCYIPEIMFSCIKEAPLVVIERPLQERINGLIEIYGSASIPELIQATQRITKKLGGSKTKEVIEAIQSNRFNDAAGMILAYYDSAYSYALSKQRRQTTHCYGENLSVEKWSKRLMGLQP